MPPGPAVIALNDDFSDVQGGRRGIIIAVFYIKFSIRENFKDLQNRENTKVQE